MTLLHSTYPRFKVTKSVTSYINGGSGSDARQILEEQLSIEETKLTEVLQFINTKKFTETTWTDL